MKIEIVAECGINHNGNMDRAREMIHVAKEFGADVAKFQIYDPKTRLDKNHPDLKPYWDIILKTKLSEAQVLLLKNECDKVGIEFLASVVTPETVKLTEAIGMKRYKISSRSIYDTDLARAIIKTEKPVIMSYGRAEPGKVPEIVRLAGMCQRFRHLYCISKYPTPLEDVHFFTVYGKNLLSIFARPYGYNGFSDHTKGITASVAAMTLGARIIEKHFTLNKNLPGPDHLSSIEPGELKLLCRMRDEIQVFLTGKGDV